MEGVPDTTSSRVPGTLPGRPIAGNRFRVSTAFTIAATVLAEPSGVSWAMYSDAAIRFARAALSQLTRTSRQSPDRLLHFLVAGEVPLIRLDDSLFNLSDLPFIHGDKFLDRLGGDERTAPVHRFRQTVELIFEFGVQAEGENRRFSHNVYIIHQLYTPYIRGVRHYPSAVSRGSAARRGCGMRKGLTTEGTEEHRERTRGTTNAAGWTRPSEFIKASIRSLYAAPNRTDTSFDTPGSCMVTPYSTGAMLMVRLLCVIRMN